MTTQDAEVLKSVATPAALAEVEELFILSHLNMAEGSENIRIEKQTAEKCERCWRHREDVGHHEKHPTLCGRCATVVALDRLTSVR